MHRKGSPSTRGVRKTRPAGDVASSPISAAFQKLSRRLEASDSSPLQLTSEPPVEPAVSAAAHFVAADTEESTKEAVPVTTHLPLSEEEDGELRSFDLCQKYGPCVGLSRLERWERAEKLGLNPPLLVREILMARSTDSDANCSMLSKYSL